MIFTIGDKKVNLSIHNADKNFTISRELMLNLLLTYVGITVYLAFAWCLLKQWLFFLIDDKEMSREQHFLSGIILVLITIFCPINSSTIRLYRITKVSSQMQQRD
ncbi:hypothetical protein N0Y54_30475 [Nostoc punctiforme UO1]|uniref:hypothetical protein n=1 Tax=Nostoc punctiforme TaxID=272131 RepID=UPI00309D3F62